MTETLTSRPNDVSLTRCSAPTTATAAADVAPTERTQRSAPKPRARGPLSDLVLKLLEAPAHAVSPRALDACLASVPVSVLDDGDAQLTLWCLYELHYRAITGVDERWEWSPDLLRVRAVLETSFESELRAAVDDAPSAFAAAHRDRGVSSALEAALAEQPGPGASRFIQGSATRGQWLEFLAAKSIYQLKEADPHSWAIPRLSGDAKSALVDIQYDEYGAGRRGHQHSQLFGEAMRLSGLDSSYGAYLNAAPACVLALNNLMSLAGLHRRFLAACLGHLALYESTSCLPNKHYAAAARRLGLPAGVQTYFLEHVEADAVHEQIALQNMLGSHLMSHPDDAEIAGFGVAAGLFLDNRIARRQLACWRRGEPFLITQI